MATRTRPVGLILAAAVGLTAFAPAADPATAPAPAELKAVLDKAYDSLKAKQNPDGSFAPKLGGPGITALTAAALLKAGRGPDDPVVAKALKYLEGRVKADGGVYDQRLANYTTCLAIVAFQDANATGRYDKVIENATRFVRSLQYGDGTDPTDIKYGGTGYDGKSRPDLSNTQFFVDALMAGGASREDAAIKKALAFVSRSQNLPGGVQRPAVRGQKATDDDRQGRVRVQTGSTRTDDKSPKRTAAGRAAQRRRHDLRRAEELPVRRASARTTSGCRRPIAWVKQELQRGPRTPGRRTAGLYYYYHTFAKAMAALGDDVFEDAKGVKHPWRKELFAKLKATQKADGSWANDNRAFLENQPELATAFAVLALGYCK